MGMARHALSTQINKYETFLHYLQKDVNDEVDFVKSIKVLQQVDKSFMMNLARHAQNTQTSLQYLCDISGNEFNFFYATKHQSFP